MKTLLIVAALVAATPAQGQHQIQRNTFGCFTGENLFTLLSTPGKAKGELVDVKLLHRYLAEGRCAWIEAGRPVNVIGYDSGWACVRPTDIQENRCLWIIGKHVLP